MATTEIVVETFEVSKTTRAQAKAGLIKDADWKSPFVVRMWNQRTQTAVLGGASSVRLAAVRAMIRAVAEGWF
jgi:hypothetical protein